MFDGNEVAKKDIFKRNVQQHFVSSLLLKYGELAIDYWNIFQETSQFMQGQ